MDQWEDPSSTHVSPEVQVKASLNRPLGRVQSLLTPDSRITKIPSMETLTEPGVMPHCHFTPNNYYAKPNPSSYYINSNSSLSPKHYSDYPGYKAGSEKEARLSGQPGSVPEYKFTKEMDMDAQRLQNSVNPFPQYYSQSVQQMSSYVSSYHGNSHKEIGEKRWSKGLTDFPDKQHKNGQDKPDDKGGFSPQPGHAYIREEGELYPGARDIPISGERNHKLMQAMQMYRTNQPVTEGHRQAYSPYPNWRNNTSTSGEISNRHKDTRLSSSDQQKDVNAINNDEMKINNKSKSTDLAGSDLRHASNPKSTFDGQDPKLDPCCSPSNFRSKDDVMSMKVRDMPQESDFIKNEVYRSRLFYRSDSMSHEFQAKEKISPVAYDRNIRPPFQWNDPASRHPLQEFQDSLQSPTKVRPNYPYSSTPGKNSMTANEGINLRPEWKNGSSQLLKAFPTDKSDLSDAKHDFEVIQTRASTNNSNPKEATERRSPSPIMSAYTPNSRMSYNAMVSPFTGSDHHQSRKFPGEQDGISDPKDALSYNDDSLLSKKEALSDDGCEESPYPGTRPDSSVSPPSPDSSMTYPPHFPHPYFASPIRGPPPIQRLQFGSPRGQHDAPQIPRPNFPFDKDFTGQFSVSGMSQEMSMGGPYMGPLPPNIVQGIGEDKDIFFCHLCSYSGKSKPEFDAHMNIHFEYNCPHCDYTSRTEGRLKRHIKDFHSDDSSRRALPGRPKVYKCKQCPFSAKEKDKFWDHARMHIKEDKLLQCPKCAFVTEYKHHLEYHLRNHFNSKPYKCNKCNYSCVNKSMLNSHMKSHTNVYQYRCSNCTYATKYCHSLKLHLRKYNHKPATVLNQDGSIPQGLDIESSGIAVVAKRGPPRGPRGMKKEKQEHYGGQMFGMPPAPLGMNPMMNGIMPFWPMLSHMGGMGHLSPSSGMLPGIGNLANQIKMHGRDGGHRRMSDSDKTDIIDNSSDDEIGHLRDDEFACRLCDFIGDNTGALCVHFVQVHKDEAREVARACGVSEENLAASLSRLIPEMMAGRRMSEPLTESDSEPSDYTPGNSTSGMASRSPEVTDMQNEQKTSESKISPPKWTELYPSEQREAQTYSQMLTSSTEHDDSMGETDILQQMTLKFGDANMLPEKTTKLPEDQRLPKEIPLDLTKPKSVSPKEMTSPMSPSSTGTDFCPTTVLETDTPILHPFKKRMIREDEEESYGHDMTAQVPRKRSRKGKAYKLDTLCMKLQERQVNHAADSEESHSDAETDMEKLHSPHSATEVKKDCPEIPAENPDGRDTTLVNFKTSKSCFPLTSHQSEDEETDEYEVNDGESDDGERRKKLNADKDKITKSPDSKTETQNIEMNTSMEVDSEFEKLQRSLAILNSGIDPEIECTSTENASTSTTTLSDVAGIPPVCSERMFPANELEVYVSTFAGEQKKQITEKLQNNCENEINHSDPSVCEAEKHLLLNSEKDINTVSRIPDSIDKTSSSNIASNEDTQSYLPITNYAEVVFPTAGSRFSGNDESQHKVASLSSHTDQAATEREPKKEFPPQDVNDDEHKANDANVSKEQITEAAQEEAVDPVEMINTVIENRKKLVPPAVRRGTELAWKLLHDTVNPVTSLPLPIDSPPLLQTQVSAPVVTCPHPMNTSSSASVRNNISLKPPHHFSQRAYPSQRPVHPMSPHMHMPLPPTPMAFIPPTSHMMPEPAPLVRPLVPPPPPMKMVKPEEYSCTYCGLSFQDCVMYTVHMGYHSNRNPFKCNSCGIVCRDKVDFFLHIARSPHA